jgi:hypothetical protein
MSYPRYFHNPTFLRQEHANGLVTISIIHECSEAEARAKGAGMAYQDTTINPLIVDDPGTLRRIITESEGGTLEALADR